jgi:hypothetical protein
MLTLAGFHSPHVFITAAEALQLQRAEQQQAMLLDWWCWRGGLCLQADGCDNVPAGASRLGRPVVTLY